MQVGTMVAERFEVSRADQDEFADDVCDEDTGECSWPFNTAP